MKLSLASIPADYPVRPSRSPKGEDPCQCGTCGLWWDDAAVTSMTPAPAARCPFESFHQEDVAMNTHSPLPWRCVTGRHIESSDLQVLAISDSTQDASFIVHCVNSHAALVGALEGLVDACHNAGYPDLGALKTARAVLAAAKGEK